MYCWLSREQPGQSDAVSKFSLAKAVVWKKHTHIRRRNMFEQLFSTVTKSMKCKHWNSKCMRAYMKILKRVWAFFFAIIPIWSAGTQALCKHLNSLFLVCICIIRSLIRRNECLDHMFLHTSHEQKLLFSWVLMVAFAFTLPSSWNCVLQVSLIFLLSFSRCVHITNKCCCDKIQHCNFMLCMHNEIASNNQLVVSENLFYHSIVCFRVVECWKCAVLPPNI